jgi:hypothetical protein
MTTKLVHRVVTDDLLSDLDRMTLTEAAELFQSILSGVRPMSVYVPVKFASPGAKETFEKYGYVIAEHHFIKDLRPLTEEERKTIKLYVAYANDYDGGERRVLQLTCMSEPTEFEIWMEDYSTKFREKQELERQNQILAEAMAIVKARKSKK